MSYRILFPLLAFTALAAPTARAQQPALAKSSARLFLSSPARAAVDATGELMVTDSKLRRVCKLAPDGHTVRWSFRTGGRPVALGALQGRVFVGLEDQQRVAIFAPSGLPLGTLGGAGFAVERPLDLEIDAAAGRLYLLDAGAREVKVFDLATPEGTLVGTIGQAGTQLSDLEHPSALALDPAAQEVLVADFGSLGGGFPPRVHVYALGGAYKGHISGKGGPTGQFFARPQGLTIGASGHLFVVDGWRGEVVIMDRASGVQVDVLGAYGKAPGELFLPLDAVRVGPDDDLHVVCNRTRRIEVFAQGGQK